MTVLRISNKQARQLFMTRQGLGSTPTGPVDVLGMICDLGFVQLDTIQVVSRAHHHILWSRNQNYRERMLNPLLANDRSIFEHFTHDASVIPMQFLPMWRRQFRRKKEQLDKSNWFKGMLDADGRNGIKARIAEEGALSTHAFETKVAGKKEMWARPPHKLALDYMWYTGELATCYRDGFTKYYNLAQRVFPDHLATQDIADVEQIDWLCRAALDRIGFGSPSDVSRFWDAVSIKETRAWADAAPDLIDVEVQAADGAWVKAVAAADIEAQLGGLGDVSSRLRILNPFDPVIRDRARLERLFGFEYRVEMFVPAKKRIWGYYVFPILEGSRFVGRIEVKGDRKASQLNVLNFWPEPGVKWTKPRWNKLRGELDRLRRFIGVDDLDWGDVRPGD